MPLKNKERIKKKILYFFYLKVAKFFSYANEIINIELSAKVYLHETYCIVLKN